jgi:hypothetical protein
MLELDERAVVGGRESNFDFGGGPAGGVPAHRHAVRRIERDHLPPLVLVPVLRTLVHSPPRERLDEVSFGAIRRDRVMIEGPPLRNPRRE